MTENCRPVNISCKSHTQEFVSSSCFKTKKTKQQNGQSLTYKKKGRKALEKYNNDRT